MDKYGLIGYPLGHSFSIGYFNEKFQNEGIDAVYENFEIADNALEGLYKAITIPFFLSYLILMAADILLYSAEYVPHR